MEIDNDLFELLTLIFLGLAVIVLLVIAVTLDKLRKVTESEQHAGEAARATPAEAPVARTQPQPATEVPATQAPAPQAAAEPEPTPSAGAPAAESDQPAPRAAERTVEPEPQDQPFERDGRWWYRRGDELLVYEEQAGQWVPAPSPTAGTGTAPTGAATATAESQDTGAFWKCPTCGAVNGSTAESCRMCFTPRP